MFCELHERIPEKLYAPALTHFRVKKWRFDYGTIFISWDNL